MNKLIEDDITSKQIIREGFYTEQVSVEGVKLMAHKINEIIDWIKKYEEK